MRTRPLVNNKAMPQHPLFDFAEKKLHEMFAGRATEQAATPGPPPRPCNSPVTLLEITKMSHAMTNHVFRLVCSNGSSYILRLYCRVSFHLSDSPINATCEEDEETPLKSRIISIEDELATMRLLAKFGIKPTILYTFSVGRIEEYLEGRPLAEIGHLRGFADECARGLAMLHTIIDLKTLSREEVAEYGNSLKRDIVWQRIYKWLTLVKDKHPAYAAPEFVQRVKALEAQLAEKIRLKDLHFCHNDTQPGNLLLTEGSKVDPSSSPPLSPQQKVLLIDFEYTGPSLVAFDVANHWCEWMYDYKESVLREEWFPTKEEQEHFIDCYNQRVAELLEPHNQASQLQRGWGLTRGDALACVPVSHLHWGLWGLVQEQKAPSIAFDYGKYAMERLKRFEQCTKGALNIN